MTANVMDLAFAPDGKTFAAAVDDQVLFREAATGRRVRSWTAEGVRRLRFSGDGRLIAT